MHHLRLKHLALLALLSVCSLLFWNIYLTRERPPKSAQQRIALRVKNVDVSEILQANDRDPDASDTDCGMNCVGHKTRQKAAISQNQIHVHADEGRENNGTEKFSSRISELNTSEITAQNDSGTKFGTLKNRTRLQRCRGCFNSDFPMLIDQKDACKQQNNQTVDLIFLILTIHAANERRQAIRKTWASVTLNNTSSFRHVFLLGMTKDAARMREVEEESHHFRDVLVGGFHDSYQNLTLKTLMGLRWAANNCPHARFWAKLDDDTWLNVPALTRLLWDHQDNVQHGIIGNCRLSPGVDRDPKSKCLRVAEHVISVSSNIPFFVMEDVYVGFCLKELRYRVFSNNGFISHASANNCLAKNESVITLHHVSTWRLSAYWTANCT
ncbi:hypothetical protein BaRGS_00038767 [Batillaria attramentaria]|uniref:Hexosyltransferase n=1 Tax=Batillaria attramentaria TaxID=370345 RepID=A0ABD0J5G4_9CAEN